MAVIRGDSGSGVATNLIWALTTLLIVGLIVWTVFFSGALKIPTERKVDINVTTPTR